MMMTAEETFDQNYWASKNPRIRATREHTLRSDKLDRQGAFQQLAIELRKEGQEGQRDLIDAPIMVDQWGPYRTMVEIRHPAGLTWVPNALQEPLGHVAMYPGEKPGIALPNIPPLDGQVRYDPDNPPEGSILVVTDATDYTPYPSVAGAGER